MTLDDTDYWRGARDSALLIFSDLVAQHAPKAARERALQVTIAAGIRANRPLRGAIALLTGPSPLAPRVARRR